MPSQTIADWLTQVGLSEYIQLFERERLELSVLPDLNDSDLEKLGLPLGHRKRLLKAIAVLPPARLADPVIAIPAQAERRQLTVMFCDLVGSTQFSQRLDPEGSARPHARLSASLGIRRGALPGSRCSVPRRWANGIFWLAQDPRGRRRACCSDRHAVARGS
jgi:hypothetical protein